MPSKSFKNKIVPKRSSAPLPARLTFRRANKNGVIGNVASPPSRDSRLALLLNGLSGKPGPMRETSFLCFTSDVVVCWTAVVTTS